MRFSLFIQNSIGKSRKDKTVLCLNGPEKKGLRNFSRKRKEDQIVVCEIFNLTR